MNEARNREMVRMHIEDRMTFAEIARLRGISLERVRQLVRRAGVTVATSAIIRYDSTHTTLICPKCSKSFELLRSQAVRRTYCSQTCIPGAPRWYTDDQLLASLRDLAVLLGHTPTQFDINAADGPYHTVYVRRFGTLRNAQASAGLKPNGRGGAGHVRIAPRVESDGA